MPGMVTLVVRVSITLVGAITPEMHSKKQQTMNIVIRRNGIVRKTYSLGTQPEAFDSPDAAMAAVNSNPFRILGSGDQLRGPTLTAKPARNPAGRAAQALSDMKGATKDTLCGPFAFDMAVEILTDLKREGKLVGRADTVLAKYDPRGPVSPDLQHLMVAFAKVNVDNWLALSLAE
jgi:hypothetical protein